jgi:NADH-quinone oxidoreductase subunit F
MPNKVKPERIANSKQLEEARARILQNRSPEVPCIVVPSGTCGRARGSSEVIDSFQQEIEKRGLGDKVTVRVTGCGGFCETEPNVVIYPEEIYY